MRRIVAALALTALVVGMLGVTPANATHGCTGSNCGAVTVALLEGQGFVCDQADVPKARCTYTSHPVLWPGSVAAYNATKPTGCSWGTSGCAIANPDLQGLGWPGFHPPATGPFSFTAGGGQTVVGTSFCVSTVGDPTKAGECKFVSDGMLTPGDPTDLGAYCGSSKGTGESTFTSGDKKTVTVADFGWEQSAATILPLIGNVKSSKTDGSNNGGAGAQVVGFTSSRGASGTGENCNITKVTTQFQVEGMVVTF